MYWHQQEMPTMGRKRDGDVEGSDRLGELQRGPSAPMRQEGTDGGRAG